MGSNMNTDSKSHFFRLGPTQIPKDVPLQKYSFALIFDMLVFEKFAPVNLEKRFNFVHFYLFGVDSSSDEVLLTKVSVDLVVSNINRDTFNPNAFKASLKLIVLYTEKGIQKTAGSNQSEITFSKEGSKSELVSSNLSVYHTQTTREMGLTGFLSDQLFLFKVRPNAVTNQRCSSTQTRT